MHGVDEGAGEAPSCRMHLTRSGRAANAHPLASLDDERKVAEHGRIGARWVRKSDILKLNTTTDVARTFTPIIEGVDGGDAVDELVQLSSGHASGREIAKEYSKLPKV